MAWSRLFVCKAEYYRSFEYCVRWKSTMYTRHSSRLANALMESNTGNASPDEETIQRKLRGRRRCRAPKKSEDGDDKINTLHGFKDIVDIHETGPVFEEDKGNFVEIADKGLDDSDEECLSDSCSIASGPSLSNYSTPSQGRCSACQKLYQKARRMKAIKNKLLDNDPKSLTSDQWVLIKKWRPRRVPNTSGKLMIVLQRFNRRHRVMKGVKQSQNQVEESSSCSRQHVFLQRNLRHCVKVPLKQQRKKNTRRKRTRNESQSSRAAKQRRLHSNTHIKCLNPTSKDVRRHRRVGSPSSRSGFDERKDEAIHEADSCLTVDLVPTTVTMKTTGSREVPSKQEPSKKRNGFRDLLVQLRSNSSMIMKETC